MPTRRMFLVGIVLALATAAPTAAQPLPNIVVLATGGTIAGAAGSDVQAAYTSGPVGKNTTASEFSLDGVTTLPRVEIVMAHENMDGVLINAAAAAGARGIIVAGVGNGNMTETALNALSQLAKKGVVVRSTRVLTGRVGRNLEVKDDELNYVASLDLNPQKARVLLRMALTKTSDLKQIQRYVEEY
jgi:L-asparaginase